MSKADGTPWNTCKHTGCGVEFSSAYDAKRHYEANPTHRARPKDKPKRKSAAKSQTSPVPTGGANYCPSCGCNIQIVNTALNVARTM